MNYAQPNPSEYSDEITKLKIAVVSAGLSHLGEQEANHSKLVRRIVEGATSQLTELGFDLETQVIQVECPGVLEIPLMTERLIAEHKLDGVLGAALIVNGEIYRHEFVAQSSLDALMQVSLSTGVPVASSLLTPASAHAPEKQFKQLHEHLYLKGQEGAGALVRQILQLNRIKD